MQPHYSQSSSENATPSSGTSLLASCKRVAWDREYPVLHPAGCTIYCGYVRRDAHEIFFRMGIVILNLIKTEINSKGNSKNRARLRFVGSNEKNVSEYSLR